MSSVDRINQYDCDRCNRSIVTQDVDKGVTPFRVFCKAVPGCQGMMTSKCYRVKLPESDVTHEWYRVGNEEVLHIRNKKATQ